MKPTRGKKRLGHSGLLPYSRCDHLTLQADFSSASLPHDSHSNLCQTPPTSTSTPTIPY